MLKHCVFAALLLVGLLPAAECQNIFAKITGAMQGDISSGAGTLDSMGNRFSPGFEDWITVYGYNDEIEVPLDPITSLPAGAAVHKPVTILKQIDKAAPLLEMAISNLEPLSIEIRFYRTAVNGTREHYLTKRFTECHLVECKTIVLNESDPGNINFPHMQEISFTYRSVETVHVLFGISSSIRVDNE